jgi:integrase
MAKVRRAGELVPKGKDKWLIRFYVGRDNATGRRAYHCEVVQGSKGEAQAVLNTRLLTSRGGQLVRKTTLTLQEYLDEWLETIVRVRVREATYESYKFHLKHYLYDALGNRNISKLTPFDVQRFYNVLREKFSPRTVQYVHAILKNALKKAVETRLISENPCTYAELPKKVKREIKVFGPDEARRFLAAAAKNGRGLIFEFALLTGARPEEYLALKWQDIDLQRRTVTFQRTLLWRKGGGWYFDEQMKTAQSRRTIPLPLELFDKLKALRVKQAEEMMKLGSAYERNDLIFVNEEGRPLNYGNITKRNFQPILKAAGLGHYRLYSLRHSCATLLLAQGENIKVIQERLGHSDVVLTLSTYSHVLEGMQAQASDKLGSLLYENQAPHRALPMTETKATLH